VPACFRWSPGPFSSLPRRTNLVFFVFRVSFLRVCHAWLATLAFQPAFSKMVLGAPRIS
jgi:hypothetical protein